MFHCVWREGSLGVRVEGGDGGVRFVVLYDLVGDTLFGVDYLGSHLGVTVKRGEEGKIIGVGES